MLSNSTLAVLIFTRDITYNPDKLTIYARITVDGRRAEISLKRYTSVNVWDVSKGRVIGTTQKARLLNSYLDEVYVQILEAHKQIAFRREDDYGTSRQSPLFGAGRTAQDLNGTR